MKRSFYLKLASDNMRKNGKTYTPYLVTCILTVAIYYIVKSLSLNPGLGNMVGSTYLNETMFLGSCVIGIFAFIFLFYTNSFLMKRRKKEFGVFNILGMEKKHISRVLAWESVYTARLPWPVTSVSLLRTLPSHSQKPALALSQGSAAHSALHAWLAWAAPKR